MVAEQRDWQHCPREEEDNLSALMFTFVLA